MTYRLLQGHVLDRLRELPDESVHCCITSPPYWGLRAYGTEPQVWGGEHDCQHQWGNERLRLTGNNPSDKSTLQHDGRPRPGPQPGDKYEASAVQVASTGSTCLLCGAWRGELGSEPTIALFIEHLVAVFSEVQRVLRSDGTCWVNLGDSYAGSGKGPSNSLQPNASQIGSRNAAQFRNGQAPTTWTGGGLSEVKPKDLCLIPERFALAMQDAGWYVRSRIAWCKTSAMPESVKDRPTSAWEHVWLLTKSARYFYDADAVRVPQETAERSKFQTGEEEPGQFPKHYGALGGHALRGQQPPRLLNPLGANQRNYWVLGPDSYDGAHFATYPRELAKRCILAGSPVGGTVLDPFAGSGTTLFVAEEQGRDSIGIELQPEYIKLAEKRMRGARTPLPGLLA